MKTGTKIKLGLMVSIGLFIALTFMPSSIADDTVLFLQPVNSAPPPGVAILLDTSGSMTSLPCAMPDGEDACGISQNNSNNYFIKLGYNPNKDYGYDAYNPTCFDSNIDPGGEGCFYGGTSVGSNSWSATDGSHVYINGYFDSRGRPSYCRTMSTKGPGGTLPSYWWDCGTITYFCNAQYPSNPTTRAQCINQLKNYGYWYRGQSSWTGDGQSFYTGNLLNFYPPKFVVTRKVMSDLITYNSNQYTNGRGVRIGIFSFNSDSSGAETDVKIYPPCSQLGSNPTPGNYLNTLYKGITWNHSTPLAGALVQVGAYFANNSPWYNNLACNGSSYCNLPSGANLGNACSANDSWCGCKYPDLYCEKNFTIVVTDGNENKGPSGLPNWPIGRYDYSDINESACSSAPGGSCNIDEVAGFLHANSIRPASQSARTTNIDTYTIGFAGTAANGLVLNTYALQRAADIGGGLFASAQNWQELEQALYKFFGDIIAKTHSYGAPNLPSIRTASQANAYIASFIPSVDNFWQGHLRAYTGAVITTTSGPVFTLFDRNGVAFTGSTVTQTCSFSEYVPPPLWDASDCLMNPVGPYCGTTPTSPRYTHVYTITPLSNPGFGPVSNNGATILKIPGNYTIPLTTANLFTTSNSNLIPSYFDVTDATTMKNIINYVLGAKDSKGHVLGDIDHSDPTVVGVDNADILTYLLGGDWLPGGEGYQQYLNRIYNQPQIVIVGGDDGMIHAFDAGSLTAATVQNGNYVPYSAQYSYGTGQELWAFIPYDILPKLQYMANPSLVNLTTTTSAQYWTVAGTFPTNNTTHVFYIDGSPMVRDVWLNGVDNGLGLAPPAAYWHTVLIIGERLGGVYYIALDITDRLHPKFMWEFTDQDMGFTFDQVFTHSPPIGPVWLGFDPQNTSTVTTTTSWVVFLNGGYDLSATTPISNWRGRGFYVVDIKTGKKLWEDHSMLYPTPASPSAVSRSLSGFSEAYLPDIGGNVWRYNFGTKTNPGAYDSSTGEVRTCISSSDTNCWSAQEIFAGPPSTSTAFPQAFYYIPSATFMPFPPYDVRISLGAGDRMNPLSCSPVNRYYSFITPQLYATQTTYGTAIPLTESNLTQLGGGTLASLNSNGWFVQLNTFTGTGQGTKNLAPSTYFNNIIYFTLFTPDPKACTTGTSTQFSCNAFGGTGVLVGLSYTGSIGTGQFYYASLGSGIPSAPVVTTQIKPGYYNMNILAGSSENTFTGIPGGQSGGFVARTLYMLYIPEYLHDLLVQQPWSTHALH
ncbi:MAG: pilus assembly protein [bacterium]